ncbi:MAG: hypothetical protein A2Y63_06750 [Candidatus Riflebacteria bacterium RBG_13_59_9]|nr:MAG: hypothetical protein A2Y63_06750 [Candidatus Riflebacteria bacterium RBG_13_59_9]
MVDSHHEELEMEVRVCPSCGKKTAVVIPGQSHGGVIATIVIIGLATAVALTAALYVFFEPYLAVAGAGYKVVFVAVPPLAVLIFFIRPLRRIVMGRTATLLRCFSCGYEQELR